MSFQISMHAILTLLLLLAIATIQAAFIHLTWRFLLSDSAASSVWCGALTVFVATFTAAQTSIERFPELSYALVAAVAYLTHLAGKRFFEQYDEEPQPA